MTLSISQEQVAGLHALKTERVLHLIAEALLAIYPREETSEAQLVEEIRPIAKDAFDRGLDDGELLAQHVYASKVFGVAYWERVPAVARVLWERSLDPGLRAAWLGAWMDSMHLELQKRKGLM